MPGKIIHTNEILVLLGDQYYAERSAKQAIEIVKRRKQGIYVFVGIDLSNHETKKEISCKREPESRRRSTECIKVKIGCCFYYGRRRKSKLSCMIIDSAYLEYFSRLTKKVFPSWKSEKNSQRKIQLHANR